jgi:hypothetical protein
MHTVESIKSLLHTNPKAVSRALIVLYNRQTSDEQSSHSTSHLNGRGFNGADAAFGTSLAKQVLAGRYLSNKQLVFARKMVIKYAKQLLEEAMNKTPAFDLNAHRAAHTKENSWWLNDARGIPLCRVCEECESVALKSYKPEVLGISGNYEDVVWEQIEED